MLLNNLNSAKLIHPPEFVINNCVYLTLMGSVAYGVSADTSDCDVYGACVPPKDYIFSPQIQGFDNIQRFEQWQQHHVLDNQKEYDFTVYGLPRYFHLLMENNPNIIDSIFTPDNCVLHSTQISQLMRTNRTIFLWKGLYYTFKGYAFSQMKKAKEKNPQPGTKRYADIEQKGYDSKFLYHLVRLIYECSMLLERGDMEINGSHREHLKAIRRGEIPEQDIYDWFAEKERALEKIYTNTVLPSKPQTDKIRQLLLDCLEIHYGNLEKFKREVTPAEAKLEMIRKILHEN